MPITRCTSQTRQPLQGHFAELLSHPESKEMGEAMLTLLNRINDTFRQTTIWGLTSLYRLVLLNQDDWKSSWLVIISCRGKTEFNFEYLLPPEEAPWHNAYVQGTAKTFEEAISYMKIAMIKSGGWTQEELT